MRRAILLGVVATLLAGTFYSYLDLLSIKTPPANVILLMDSSEDLVKKTGEMRGVLGNPEGYGTPNENIFLSCRGQYRRSPALHREGGF